MSDIGPPHQVPPGGAWTPPAGQYPPGQYPPGQYPPGPPVVPPADRAFYAWQRRFETDYIFDFWSALGWTILTLGIFGYYVLYQLVRRMRDHNIRRVELFDAALEFAWQEAGRRGLQEELTPSFQRAEAHMTVLRRMIADFRDPVIWLVLAIVTGITEIVAFVLLDQDLVRHDRSEVGVEYELALIFGRFGQSLPSPDQTRVKGTNNYAGRILAAIFTLGLYMLWWTYNQMNDPNSNFWVNWPQEDALVAAIHALR